MREIFRLVGKIALDGTVELDEKLKAIDKQAGKVGASLNKMGKDLTKIGMEFTKNVTVPIAAAGLAIYKGIELASDLAETVSKTGEIFGSSSAQLQEWASGAAESMGQSKQQALDAAATFGIFGKSAGLAGADLVGFSTQFTGLASDLASFNNTTPEEAIVAIGAAFRGEMEPIRRYGVLLDDASLRQQALEMGIVSSIKNALTPQQKVLAASALIMKQTATAQGDFARTSDGLANQQRILKAEITNMATELGAVFLPVAKTVVGILRDNFLPVLKSIVEWFKSLSPEMRDTVVILGLMAAAFGPVLMIAGKMSGVIGVLIPLIAKLVTGQLTLNAAMAANPIGLVITLIAALIAVGVLLYKNWDSIKEGMVGAWDAIVYGFKQAISWIKVKFYDFALFMIEKVESIANVIPGLSNQLNNIKKGLEGWKKAEEETLSLRKESREETKKAAQALKDQEEAAKKQAETAKYLAKEETQRTKKLTADQIEAAKKLKEERERFEQEWSTKLFEQSATRDEIREQEKQAALLKAEELGAGKQQIEAYYDQLEAENRILKNEAWAATSGEITGKIGSIFSSLYQSKINEIDDYYNKEKAAIENSALTEEEKAARMAKLDAEVNKKKNDEAKKQAKKEKELALFQTVVNTSAAIVKTLASVAWPLNIIMSALVGAMGLAEVKAIKSKPLPALKDGGTAIKPGWSMVTEEGPELLHMPKGASVVPLNHPAAAGALGGGGFKTANIYLNLDGRTLAKALGQPLVEEIQLLTGLRA